VSQPAALPGVLREIAAVAGEDAALAIARARGGTSVYFPPVPSEDHWLCALVGREAAQAVCDQLTCGVGPLRVDLPRGPTRHAASMQAKIDTMLAEGRSELDINRATGYTIRAIRWRRARLKLRCDDRQLKLI
jgi:hypothetical protein